MPLGLMWGLYRLEPPLVISYLLIENIQDSNGRGAAFHLIVHG